MGHFYGTNLTKTFVRQLYAKGTTNINDVATFCLKHIKECDEKREAAKKRGDEKMVEKWRERRDDYGCHAAEGCYIDRGMICHGLVLVSYYLKKQGIVEPVLETDDDKEIYKLGELDAEKYDLIMWRFTKTGRTAYLKNEIQPIAYVCT
jgi:hypothetical protein